MFRTIQKPYKVNCKLYTTIITISLALIFVSCFINEESCVKEFFNGIGYGCFGSAVVALLIDIVNTKHNNQRANQLYDFMYNQLKADIMMYCNCWSVICAISYPQKGLEDEEHTWFEWFGLLLLNFKSCSRKRKDELIYFWRGELTYYADRISDDIDKIESVSIVAASEEIYDENMKKIIGNLKQTFKHFNISLYADRYLDSKSEEACDFIFKWLSAVNEDVKNNIEEWKDIAYYNNYKLGVDYMGMTSEKKILDAIYWTFINKQGKYE